jgi:uroporphyrinogen-III decarboxylase
MERKRYYLNTMKGASFDILELGGGDASSTVISPKIFDEFVAPYDKVLIECAQKNGQRIAYHTCGGMMPILENIVSMHPDAMETFTPPEMQGDVDLKKAREILGNRVCMIGGFDQFHFLKDCKPEETRSEVKRCFREAGTEGAYILSPSDHFFDADPVLIQTFVDAARECKYNI